MKVYGLQIGEVGVEFSTRDEREKAMILFCRGSCVKIGTGEGPKFRDGIGAFSTYERETEQPINICAVCYGSFSAETCPKRSYPHKRYGRSEYEDTEGHICDGCLAARREEVKLHEAKKVVAAQECVEL